MSLILGYSPGDVFDHWSTTPFRKMPIIMSAILVDD